MTSKIKITPEMIEAAALVLIEAEMASDTRSTRRLVARILNRAMEELPRRKTIAEIADEYSSF